MFRDDYREQMNKQAPSAETRARIKENLTAAVPVKKQKNPAVPWRIGFAVTAAVAVVLTVTLGHFTKMPNIDTAETGDVAFTLFKSDSYETVYDKLNALRQNGDEEIYYEYEYISAQDGSDMDTGTTGSTTGTAAAGGSAKTIEENSTSSVQTYGSVGDDPAVSDTNDAESIEYSDTTTQVEGVAEADIVKTDGKYIYALADNTVRVIEANSGNPRLVQTVSLPCDGDRYYHDMYLSGDRLVIMGSVYTPNENVSSKTVSGTADTYDYAYIYASSETELLVYDVSVPDKAALVGSRIQSGDYNSSRMIDGIVYVISNHSVNLNKMDKDTPESYVPSVSDGTQNSAMEPDSVMCPTDELSSAAYIVACSYRAEDSSLVSAVSVLGGADTVYSSTDNIITACEKWESGSSYTAIYRFSLKDGEINYEVSGLVPGSLINQFAIDEYNGYFRFVTTSEEYVYEYDGEVQGESTSSYDPTASSKTASSYTTYVKYSCTVNGLYVLDGDLKQVGKADGLARDEQVYSVRFMGDVAYFVTFKQVDPLFSVDLSDPTNPTVIGELKIPGFSEYLYHYGDGLLLGIGQDVNENTLRTTGLKLSMFDVSDPANVTEKDKTSIDYATYSEALDNHKACIVHPEKNLIGFAVSGKTNNSKGNTYVIYSYEDGGFKELARIDCDDFMSKRGLFIGDVFYIVGQKSVRAFSLDGFTALGELKF